MIRAVRFAPPGSGASDLYLALVRPHGRDPRLPADRPLPDRLTTAEGVLAAFETMVTVPLKAPTSGAVKPTSTVRPEPVTPRSPH